MWKTVISKDGKDDESFEVRGYRRHSGIIRSIFTHILSLLCLGIPYFLAYFVPSWRLRLFYRPCSLGEAEFVLIRDRKTKVTSIETVLIRKGELSTFPEHLRFIIASSNDAITDTSHLLDVEVAVFRYFERFKIRYGWNVIKNNFVKINDDPETLSWALSHTGNDRDARRIIYGPNSIDVEVKSYAKLLVEEVLNPFYIFQIASIILWSLDNYLLYAGCILLISAISILLSLVETRRQSQTLRDMTVIEVDKEDDSFEDPHLLVPGDIISVRNHEVMTCDAVVISGSCLVNESMLTGESVPVLKTEILVDDVIHITNSNKHNTLFSGTKVIQTRNYGEGKEKDVKAIVIRTGFATAKGELVRSILFPRPVNFKFYQDSIKFVIVLFAIASVGMAYCIYVMRFRPIETLILRCLDIITIVVPPALPAAMTVGTFYAQSRLKKAKIFCIAPQRINVGGKLKLICFDKTGTLTEDGLDFYGIAQAEDLTKVIEDTRRCRSNVVSCLASCHSISLVDNGELTGDPLDVKMFESTGWILEEPDCDDRNDTLVPVVVKPRTISKQQQKDEHQLPIETELEELLETSSEIGIIRQFPFNSEVARMSVIVRQLGDHFFRVFTKGAPEKIAGLCTEIPDDFHDKLKSLAMRGFRVIALATRVLSSEYSWHKIQKMKRDVIERDLQFLGFLIMRNTLKPQSRPVIESLKRARIRCVMVTGDNLLTALSVSRECGMVEPEDTVMIVEASEDGMTLNIRPSTNLSDSTSFSSSPSSIVVERNLHFAICGRSWSIIRTHFPSLIPRFVEKGTIFARMDPEQKAQLVEEIGKIDYVVGMCGDGANDCGALKAAHVGISLSEAEASVAAPFTSSVPDITCVPTVIQEGRCALTTSFGLFKYMALYSLVQFISVLTLYTLGTNLGDAQFLYIDLIITTTVAVFMSWTEPYPNLVSRRPPGSLISGSNLFSIFSQILVCLFIQIGAYFYLTTQRWYMPNKPSSSDDDDEIIVCWETTTIFFVSAFQYLILAAAFSKGPPFRKPFYSNKYFMGALMILIAFTILLGIFPGKILAHFFELEFNDHHDFKHLHLDFRLHLLIFVLLNAVLSFGIENVIAESSLVKKVSHKLVGKQEPKNRFKRIQREMAEENWPCFEGQRVKAASDYLRSPGVS